MILLINICKEKLHYYEFVKPIEDILKSAEKQWIVKHYKEMKEGDLKKAEKVIICGTSLGDNEFIEDIGEFSWIKEFNKPILGICGGMQIISLILGGKIGKKKEIGFYYEDFSDFLGLKWKQEVYHLHNYYASLLKEFKEYSKSDIPQAIKHKQKEIYGVLFHPEVRNKDLIINFAFS